MKRVNVGLIGFGTIGSGVVKVLRDRKAQLHDLTGVEIDLKYICDKDLSSDRGIPVSKDKLTKDVNKILNNPEIDIVVELMGGIRPAKDIILTALRNRKHVVTANKALLAQHGEEIFKTAVEHSKDVRFEGSIGGGIPIVKALSEGFVSSKINAIYGIINGTSNYILSRMSDDGCDFKVALQQAKKMGVAETDPSLDLNGMDSAHKLVLLAELGFGVFPKLKQVYCEGILGIEPIDIRYAREMGYEIKLLAIAKRTKEGIDLRVHPTFVPSEHVLANVKGVYNAIYVKGDLIGESLFYGEGAGKFPTANAVVSDIVDLAKRTIKTSKIVEEMPSRAGARSAGIKKIEDVKSTYYIRFSAVDKPGVLAKISGILAKNNISISNVTQKGERGFTVVPIVMMTHIAQESKLRKALELIDKLSIIKKKSVAIRMEKL